MMVELTISSPKYDVPSLQQFMLENKALLNVTCQVIPVGTVGNQAMFRHQPSGTVFTIVTDNTNPIDYVYLDYEDPPDTVHPAWLTKVFHEYRDLLKKWHGNDRKIEVHYQYGIKELEE